MKTLHIKDITSFSMSAKKLNILCIKVIEGIDTKDIVDSYFEQSELNIIFDDNLPIGGMYKAKIVGFTKNGVKSYDNVGYELPEIEIEILINKKINNAFCPVLKHFDDNNVIGAMVIENNQLIAKLNGAIKIELLEGLGFNIGFRPVVKDDGYFSEMIINCLSLGGN